MNLKPNIDIKVVFCIEKIRNYKYISVAKDSKSALIEMEITWKQKIKYLWATLYEKHISAMLHRMSLTEYSIIMYYFSLKFDSHRT